jgi:hypothetical protein
MPQNSIFFAEVLLKYFSQKEGIVGCLAFWEFQKY